MLYELRWSITTKVDYKVDYHSCDKNIVTINPDEKKQKQLHQNRICWKIYI